MTLSICDPEIVANIKSRISDYCAISTPRVLSILEKHSATGPAGSAGRSAKNMASLVEVLSTIDSEAEWLSVVKQDPKVEVLLSTDLDGSATIVRSWSTSVRECLESLGFSSVNARN